MGFQILFSDLDGTLLNSKGEISQANKDAAQKAMAAGKQIVLCSGRSWMSLAFYESQLGINRRGGYGVSFNGGIIYAHITPGGEDREILYKNVLPNELGQRIISRLKELDGDILVYAGDSLYSERKTDFNEEYGRQSKLKIHTVENFNEIQGSIIKILAEGLPEDLKRIHEKMLPRFKDKIYIVFSSPYLLEFGPTEAHKGGAVKFLANHLHIPMDEVIAMGDESNDLTMLQTAGLGIAVANAVDEAKAAAKFVSKYSNNEDAFARVIEEYLLGED